MRGAIYGRCEGREYNDFKGNSTVMHILEHACGSIRQVTRSTFASELLSAGDTLDNAVLLSHMIFEVENGPISVTESRQRRLSGGYTPVALYIDAKSVYAATTATFVKTPAEKSLLTHVQYLREMLDTGVIRFLFWVDTRDMLADGLTKGAVARELLHEAMNGYMPIKHESEPWESKLPALGGKARRQWPRERQPIQSSLGGPGILHTFRSHLPLRLVHNNAPAFGSRLTDRLSHVLAVEGRHLEGRAPSRPQHSSAAASRPQQVPRPQHPRAEAGRQRRSRSGRRTIV